MAWRKSINIFITVSTQLVDLHFGKLFNYSQDPSFYLRSQILSLSLLNLFLAHRSIHLARICSIKFADDRLKTVGANLINIFLL